MTYPFNICQPSCKPILSRFILSPAVCLSCPAGMKRLQQWERQGGVSECGLPPPSFPVTQNHTKIL